MLTPPGNYQIRTMTASEVGVAVEWAALEGWNPGLSDAACFFAADPTGFLVGTIDGEPVSTISAVKYGDKFGFVGLYIVKPEFRGTGCGLKIWNAAMTYLEGRTIGLDGVVEQQANYSKSGFVFAHNNVRYQGIGGRSNSLNDEKIVPLSRVAFEELDKYDQQFFLAKRSEFLRSWISQPQVISIGIRQAGQLVGYGVLRVCRTGFKIGPLFADTLEVADRLFVSLTSHVPEGLPFFLDVSSTNKEAVDMAKSHSLEVVFETARMYSGTQPELRCDGIYGITTFELG